MNNIEPTVTDYGFYTLRYLAALTDPSLLPKAILEAGYKNDSTNVLSVSSPNRTYHTVFQPELAYQILNYYHDEFPVMPLQGTIMKGFPTFVSASDDADKWKVHRRGFSKLFSKQKGLKNNLESAIDTIQTHLTTWEDKTAISVGDEAGQLTLKYLSTSLYGVSMSSEEARKVDLASDGGIQNYQIYEGLTRGRVPEKMMINITGYTTAMETILEVIGQLRGRAPENSAIHSQTDEEVSELLFSGHSTLKTTIYNALLLLSQNPEWQTAIRQETIDDGLPLEVKKPDKDGNIPSVTKVIMETMRLFPSVTFLGRQVNTDIEIDGYHFKESDTVIIPIIAIHRNSNHYKKPNEFSPDEHFSLDAIKNRPKGSFIPFGAGYNSCPAGGVAIQEGQIILSMIHSDFVTSSSGPLPSIKSKLTLIPDRDATIQVEPRASTFG